MTFSRKKGKEESFRWARTDLCIVLKADVALVPVSNWRWWRFLTIQHLQSTCFVSEFVLTSSSPVGVLLLQQHTRRCWPFLWQLWYMALLAARSSHRCLGMDRDTGASGHTGFFRDLVDISLFWLSGLPLQCRNCWCALLLLLTWVVRCTRCVCICSWQRRWKWSRFWKGRKKPFHHPNLL